MAKWKCNSCGSVYSDTAPDGTRLYHACHPDVIEHAQFSDAGAEITPEKRTPRKDLRDENLKPGIIYVEGVPMREVPDPETPSRLLLRPATVEIIAEGAGRTLVEE